MTATALEPRACPPWRRAVRLTTVFIAYVAVARVGLSFDAVSGFATLVWPPTGLALACVLRFGLGLAPALFAGAFTVNAWSGAPAWVALGIAVGNTLEAIIAARVLERFGFDTRLGRLRDVAALIGFAALGATMVSATIGVASLFAGGLVSPAAVAPTWRAWWVGDLIGALVVAPALLVLMTPTRSVLELGARRSPALRRCEVVLLAVAAFAMTSVIFGTRWLPERLPSPQPHVLFPVLIWGAVRFGQRGAALTTFVISAAAVLATALGSGPFAGRELSESLLHLQTFMAITAATTLTLGAVVLERERAQRTAREALQRTSAVLEAAIDSIVSIDQSGTIVEFNSAAEHAFGYRREEVVGRSMAELLIPPRLRQAHSEGMRRYLGGGPGRVLGKRLELPALRKDGTEFPIELTIVRIPSDGPPVFTSFIRDLTELKRTEADLQRQYLLLRAVIEGTSDAVFVKDLEGRYLLINSAGAKIAGSTPEQIHGKDDTALFAPEFAQPIMASDREIMQANAIVTIEETMSVDGSELTFLSIKAPFKNSEGEVCGVVGISRDISERKRLESELRDAVRARDEFLSIASHELRTPLTALGLQLAGLRRLARQGAFGSEPDKLMPKLDLAVRQSERLATLVERLLDVSRLNDRSLQLELEPFDLVELVAQLVDAFSQEARRAGCDLSRRGAENVPVHWDRSRAEQALSNLISNAIKYGAGHPIDVGIERRGEHVTVCIQDHGIGIAAEDLKRIFGRFERAAPARHYGGLGLGLYITRQIVDAHGGSIDVAAEPGRGATFRLHMPRVCEPASTTAS